MKHIIWKTYLNVIKEEKWLNEMAAKGLALSDYSWCRYVFEDAPKGEYIYHIELLEHSITHPESQKYIEFLEDTGVEFVASYMRWVYFRKKAADGAFDLYTDIDTRIKHYKRIHTLWSSLMTLDFIVGFSNLAMGIWRIIEGDVQPNLFMSLPLILMGCIFFAADTPIRSKLKALRKEKTIRE